MKLTEIRQLLEEKHNQYNRKSFIENDPVSIPHQFSLKEDIEISAFLSATLAWGQRKTIINNALKIIQWMDYQPFEFIMNFRATDLKPFSKFVHRTFNNNDCLFFLHSLQHLYRNYGGLESTFNNNGKSGGVKERIILFRKIFLETAHLKRSEKHVSDPSANSSCKRLNLFLRWMVRKDERGVDFGIWKNIRASDLICPLDIHTGNTARAIGLLKRRQNDWKAAEELTSVLRKFCPEDPVKYDFALFGMGIHEGFS